MANTDLPSWSFSDNAAAAVMTGKVLGCATLRDKLHLFGICIKRVFYLFDKPKPGQVQKEHAYPQILKVWEKMRAIGLYYLNHADRQRDWYKTAKIQGCEASHPHRDSSSKWGSACERCIINTRAAMSHRHRLSLLQGTHQHWLARIGIW